MFTALLLKFIYSPMKFQIEISNSFKGVLLWFEKNVWRKDGDYNYNFGGWLKQFLVTDIVFLFSVWTYYIFKYDLFSQKSFLRFWKRNKIRIKTYQADTKNPNLQMGHKVFSLNKHSWITKNTMYIMYIFLLYNVFDIIYFLLCSFDIVK